MSENECIRFGKGRLHLTGADAVDYTTFEIRSVHPQEEQHG